MRFPDLGLPLDDEIVEDIDMLADIYELVALKYRNDIVIIAQVEALARHFASSPIAAEKWQHLLDMLGPAVAERVEQIRAEMVEEPEPEERLVQ